MRAAVVESFDRPPRYADFDEPEPRADEVVVSMRAAALSQLVRAQAAGRHYAGARPPFVPGADGVGVLEDGQRVYFAFPRAPVGAMAERVAVKKAYTFPLPSGVDDVTAAAIANPGMSSWAALEERAAFRAGESVLVNGATGASGRLAIRIARHLGAARVVATGRNPASERAMLELGADAFVPLDAPHAQLVQRFRGAIGEGVDVVLDYVWGPSAEAIVAAIGQGGATTARRVRFVNLGSMGGPTISLPAAALRSSALELLGSGLGSLPHDVLVGSIAKLMQVIGPAGLTIETRTVPLSDVESEWGRADGGRRVVFTV